MFISFFFAFFFFFSSRRRHTRCSRDWSSDVCSSDLGNRPGLPLSVTLSFPSWFSPLFLAIFASRLEDARAAALVFWSLLVLYQLARVVWQPEAGRFSVNRSREDRRRAIYARPRNEGCLGTLHGKTFRMRSMPVFSPPTPVSVSPNPDNS